MTRPVTIPVRFGTRRFGKVSGSVLDADGATYPQPAGDRPWQKGMCTLLSPAEADGDAASYGFRPNATMSGGRMQLYGKPLDGWVCCDTHGNRWLIKPTFGTPDFSTDAISIDYSIVRFGVFGSEETFVPTTGTLTLDDIGMNGFLLDFDGNGLGGGRTQVTWTWYGTDSAFLVSTNSDGTKAIILLAAEARGYFSVNNDLLGALGLDHHPMGYLEITATSAVTPGAPPTLALAVLKTLQQTVGEPSCDTSYGPSGYSSETLCSGESGPCIVEYRNAGTNTVTGGLSGVLAAVYYDGGTLKTITASVTYAATSTVDAPTINATTIELDSTYQNVVTTTLTSGTTTITATLTDTHTVNTFGTCNCSGGFGQEITSTHTWVYAGDDGTTLSYGWTDEEDTSTGVLTLWTSTLASGCYMLTDVYHWYPDDWIFRMGYYLDYSTDGGSLVPSIRRYSYNVLGLQLLRVVHPDDDVFNVLHMDNAVSPAGKVLSSTFSAVPATDVAAKYGAYNPRTGEAVACQQSAVCYV